MPDQDIAALRLDDHSPGGVITGHAQRHLWHACILRMMKSFCTRCAGGGVTARSRLALSCREEAYRQPGYEGSAQATGARAGAAMYCC
jgi:hypothetical protein